MSDLTKIASAAPAILYESARTMRKLADDNSQLTAEKEALETELHVHKIAMRMEERGLEQGLSLAEKIASLQGASPERLAAIEAAVEMSAGGFKLASLKVSDEEQTSSTKLSSGELGDSARMAQINDFILSGLALS